jgi:hypothetical protein
MFSLLWQLDVPFRFVPSSEQTTTFIAHFIVASFVDDVHVTNGHKEGKKCNLSCQ